MSNSIENHVTIAKSAKVTNSHLKQYSRLKEYYELHNSTLGDIAISHNTQL